MSSGNIERTDPVGFPERVLNDRLVGESALSAMMRAQSIEDESIENTDSDSTDSK